MHIIATSMDGSWEPSQGALLRAVRKARRQTQEECLGELRKDFGATAAAQGTISRWERGRAPRGREDREAVDAYLKAHSGAPSDRTDPLTAMPVRNIESRELDAEEVDAELDEVFKRIVGPLSGTTANELKIELAKALIHRIRSHGTAGLSLDVLRWTLDLIDQVT